MLHHKELIVIFGSHRLKEGDVCYNHTKRFIKSLVKKYPNKAICTGGGPGLMNMTNKIAEENGNPSVAVNMHFAQEPHNRHTKPEDTLCALDFYYRQQIQLDRAEVVICLPGGPGTLFELFDAIVHIQTERRAKVPIYLVGKYYWQSLEPMFKTMESYGTLVGHYKDLFKIIDCVSEMKQL